MSNPETTRAERVTRGNAVIEFYESLDGLEADSGPVELIADILHALHAEIDERKAYTDYVIDSGQGLFHAELGW